MVYSLNHAMFLPMLGVSLFLLTCIPREDPVETIVLTHEIELPATLQENSGMTEAGGLIWFINDGGDEPAIYGYNREQDTIERIVIIKDAINTDWEEITQNEQHLFIGDFGNNAGDRTDLKVYIIDKSALLAETDTVIPSGIVAFSYADQTDFTPSVENTPFDCEAMIATGDSLFLFTKDWKDMHTRVYSLSVEPGTQIAKFRKQWDVSGLITAAAWSSEKHELILLGYAPLFPFIWVYSGFSEGDLSFEESKRADFSSYWGTQTEGIMISSTGSVYVSAETSAVNNASLYRIEMQY